MSLSVWFVMPIFLFAVTAFAAEADKKADTSLYAVLETTQGNITVRLFEKEVPKTVANFVGLAEGTKPFTDPKTGEKVTRAFYDGLIFHRVIPGFMIQGGDPRGNGTGDPGYKFEDEFVQSLQFDQPGRLAMANAGPNTNGSQFFITDGLTPHLNMRHTIFGQVTQGQEIVHKIATVPTGPQDKPLTPVAMKIKIVRK
jgi:peptidyl-prolyl cis-trans isomerase A (cyclophilin A)